MNRERASHVRKNYEPKYVLCGSETTPRLEDKNTVFLRR